LRLDNHGEYDMLVRQLEALLFVSPQPVSENELASALGLSPAAVSRGIAKLKALCDEGRGLTLIEVAGGWQMATAPDLESTVAEYQGMAAAQRVRLSKAALETLAVVAYNQPITRGEMEEIRTVRCDRVVETLQKHGLVRVAGRKKSTGNPLLYRTTDRFLEIFGLDSIASLPTLEELQDTFVKTPAQNDWETSDE
jgi:segregation and condensation protein B